MAFKVGSVNYFPGVFNTPETGAAGAMLVNNGTNSFFAYPGSPNTIPGTANLQYRSIFTHGYLAGGYKGSNPWRNVNKTWHATDITFSCGEQIDRAMAYGDGTFSDYNAYVFGTINSFSGGSSHTSSYSLHTGVARQKGMQQWRADASSTTVATSAAGVLTTISRPTKTDATGSPGDGIFGSATLPFGYLGIDPAHDSQGVAYGSGPSYYTSGTTTTVTQAAATDSNVIMDPSGGVGGWDTSVNVDYHGCAADQINQVGYVFGGGTQTTQRLHMPTEIMYTTTTLPVASSMTTCTFGATQAFVGCDNSGFSHYYFNFSNQSFASWATINGNSPWNKALSSKLGQHYWAIGDNMYKISDSTGGTLSTFAKTFTSASEENFEMGQNWGYMMGNYNGQQNNQTMKVSYTSDVCTTMGFATMPKGHFGQSSGACASAAATVTAGYTL
jgi:hypothetical protein